MPGLPATAAKWGFTEGLEGVQAGCRAVPIVEKHAERRNRDEGKTVKFIRVHLGS